MTVYNSDDDSINAEHPTVTVQGNKGAQTLHFRRGGTFYIKVDSQCDWHLAVVDLGGQ